ncbi:methyltransferase type 11 [Phyllobacterium salinisoli]|uniref:Methyltransferase type 11 n=1 Tax=Phyllobacterium salinisoli TaxID=1899321 RepID=A0A368K969_9HYPH|nr:small ribosomal subunit Rsm22 family protein [Phyllobacterium salinisoli]RCS25908.1 methyltransferase type 11 [Phyllobacterium salinisoli]
MELPSPLRLAVDAALEGSALADLKRAADLLSRRYRAETRDGALHLSSDLAARAYLATRLPATYAAVRASMESTAELTPDFAPKSLLDVGAGPGTALWAASDCWPSLETAVLLEASPSIRALGEELSRHSRLDRIEWRSANVTRSVAETGQFDLVTLAYVLDELSPEEGLALTNTLWQAAKGMLVVVEPGTPAGWRRMMAVRKLLLEKGAHLAAPCVHAATCPLMAPDRVPDWCHFSRRVARSRLHRLAKGGEVPWEDEKYIYLAATRFPAVAAGARVLAPPRASSGKVELKLCRADGTVEERVVTKRDGEAYRKARRLDWGDAV